MLTVKEGRIGFNTFVSLSLCRELGARLLLELGKKLD